MSKNTLELVYVVDEGDRLIEADSGYFAFAAASCWAGAEDSIGEPLWDFVAGTTMRKIQESLLRRVRATGDAVEFPFRCDGPVLRREMTIAIEPEADGRVAFRASVVSEQARRYQALLDPAAPRGRGLIEMCGWCDRFEVGGAWVEVERATAELGLMTAAELPAISHGVCRRCSAMLLGE